MGFELIGVVVITGDNPGRSDHKTLLVHDRQNIAGLRFLASLIGNRLAAFLRQSMRPIQVQFGHIQVVVNKADAVLPQVFETVIATPVRKVQIDGGITNFFFSALGNGSIGNSAHWQPVCNQCKI